MLDMGNMTNAPLDFGGSKDVSDFSLISADCFCSRCLAGLLQLIADDHNHFFGWKN